MKIQARMFGRKDDVKNLRGLVASAMSQRLPGPSYYHVGDVTWQLFQNTAFDPLANIRLWESEDGRLQGFVWFEPLDTFQMEVNPEMRTNDILSREIMAWADKRRQLLPPDAAGKRYLTSSALDGDRERIAFLERQGFQRTKGYNIRFHCSLDSPIAKAMLPDEVTVRPVGGEEEIEERVNVHRDAWTTWGQSKFTAEAYRRLRMAPGYEPELDLVAVTQEGIFVAYCTCWLDEMNKVGEFEPVGTRPAYRLKGLNRAVALEGLHRMQKREMRSAIVQTASFNEAAIGLYRSVGFEEVDREHFYIKSTYKN